MLKGNVDQLGVQSTSPSLLALSLLNSACNVFSMSNIADGFLYWKYEVNNRITKNINSKNIDVPVKNKFHVQIHSMLGVTRVHNK